MQIIVSNINQLILLDSSSEHTRLLVMLKLTLIVSIMYTSAILALPQYIPQRVIENGPLNPYDYSYKVESPSSNTFYGKNEAGDGLGKVTGSFYVLLPDGRLMTVDYFVDGNSGFVPRISFSTKARV